MSTSIAFAPLVRAFFTDYLLRQKQVSPQTVAAYRDAVRLLLTFLQQHRQLAPDQVTLDSLDVPVILAFLDHLETDRHNSSRSRNARLAALRSFFRFVAFRCPDRLDLTTRVLTIPRKKATRRVVHFLTRGETEALLIACDRRTWGGRRDHALLLTMYNTGARVSELAGLRRVQVRFGPSTIVQLLGKGRKERTVPLWARTGRVLRTWFDELGDATPDLAFPNAQGSRLTRHGVAFLLRDIATRAQTSCPSLTTKRVSPHVVRHSTAMHLLQAGVDLATIALWLGHERLETTHLYLEADLELKERALKQLSPLGPPARRFKADESLLGFLASL
jgi:site-specific recombinase XerD